MSKKPRKFEIDWKVLESISRYYEFPLTVFYLPKPLRGKRRNSLRRTVNKFKSRLERLVDEFLDKI